MGLIHRPEHRPGGGSIGIYGELRPTIVYLSYPTLDLQPRLGVNFYFERGHHDSRVFTVDAFAEHVSKGLAYGAVLEQPSKLDPDATRTNFVVTSRVVPPGGAAYIAQLTLWGDTHEPEIELGEGFPQERIDALDAQLRKWGAELRTGRWLD